VRTSVFVGIIGSICVSDEDEQRAESDRVVSELGEIEHHFKRFLVLQWFPSILGDPSFDMKSMNLRVVPDCISVCRNRLDHKFEECCQHIFREKETCIQDWLTPKSFAASPSLAKGRNDPV